MLTILLTLLERNVFLTNKRLVFQYIKNYKSNFNVITWQAKHIITQNNIDQVKIIYNRSISKYGNLQS